MRSGQFAMAARAGHVGSSNVPRWGGHRARASACAIWCANRRLRSGSPVPPLRDGSSSSAFSNSA